MSDPAAPWPLTLDGKPPVLVSQVRQRFLAAAEVHLDQARSLTAKAKGVFLAMVVLIALSVLSSSLLAWVLAAGAALAWITLLVKKGWALDEAHGDAPVHRLLERLLPDFAFGQRLRLMLDPRSPDGVSNPFRSARSPYSGATKSHHRLNCLGLKGYTVDGTLLALDVSRRVKAKGGAVIRDKVQLKGRLRPGPGRSTAGLKVPEGLKLWPGREGGEIAFLGEFATLEEALERVARLMAATLPQAGPGKR